MSEEILSIILPPLGENIEKAKVVAWHCKVGDLLSADDDVAEVVTDKATFHVPSPASGILKEIFVPAGQEAYIGQTLASMDLLKST